MPDARRACIVVVDDDESFRESLQELLRSHSFEVRAFASAEALLAVDAQQGASCLLLDATLPGVSGVELVGRLRERGSLAPIVFLTGYAGPAVERRLLAGGGVACLSKPFEEEALLEAIERAFAAGANAARLSPLR